MPRLTVAHPRGQGGTGQGEGGGGGRDWKCKWMEGVQEDVEGEPAEGRRQQSSSNQTPGVCQPQQTSWAQTLRTLRSWRGWYSSALVGALWSFCQLEAPLHPSLLPLDVCWRLLLVCLLWVLLGGCVHALKCCLKPGQKQGEPPLRIQQNTVTETRNNRYSWTSHSRSPGPSIPLALALADSLFLCVLQEPLSDPSVPQIKTLLSRLEGRGQVSTALVPLFGERDLSVQLLQLHTKSVSHTVEKADTGSGATLEEVDQDFTLIKKVKLMCSYLQQRTGSLCKLVQVQGDFEASVKDMLAGLNGLWVQLEELHTKVTFTKEGNQGCGDLASALMEAKILSAVLDHYRDRLQSCQTHLEDSTLLLQELTWSHTHTSNSVRSSSESVWPELLLQSNIEQFDKVQENFFSLEQQTFTFKAHLEGLGDGNQNGHAGPLAHANRAHSGSVRSQNSPHLHSGRTNSVSLKPHDLTTDAENDSEADNPLSLCERSALQFSSTIGRLRISGRRK